METFSALLAICAGNSPVTGEFPAERTVTQSFDVFFDLHLDKGWVNNREVGDLGRHRAHYDVTRMWILVRDAIWCHGSWSTLNRLLSPDGTKPLSVPVFTWINENKLQWNCNICTIILIQENADESAPFCSGVNLLKIILKIHDIIMAEKIPNTIQTRRSLFNPL